MSSAQFPAIAVIPAAGVGQRMASNIPKQYLNCLGKPLIWYALKQMQQCDWIEHIFVSISSTDEYWQDEIGDTFAKVILVEGGASRAHSVLNGLNKALEYCNDNTWTLVHDAARPCLFDNDLEAIKQTLFSDEVDGLILADKVHDTVKSARDNELIDKTVDRSTLWRAQTPQVFPLGALQSALQKADLQLITDEASAMESVAGSDSYNIKLLQGDPRNIKVTRPQDLSLVSLYLSEQKEN